MFYSDFLHDRQSIARILDDVASISAKTDIDEIHRRQIFNELAHGQTGGLSARASRADESELIARISSYAAQEYDRSRRSMQQIESVVATSSGVAIFGNT